MKLFCCNTYEELKCLKRNFCFDYVVATNRYEFYQMVNGHEKNSVFLESFETNPQETVWNILDQINGIIDCCKKPYSELFYLSYHIEGGFASKISQIIINLNFIGTIIKKYEIDEIFVFDHKDNWVMNESIFLHALSFKIPCHVLAGKTREMKSALKTLETLGKTTEDVVEQKYLAQEEKRLAVYLGKGQWTVRDTAADMQKIGALYCCKETYDKHVNWLLKKISVLDNVKIICYWDSDDIRKFTDRGLEVDCLENYFVIDDFTEAYEEMKGVRKKILGLMNKELSIVYQGVDLTEYVILKISNLYYREMLDHLYMKVCANRYFSSHKFEHILMWGDANFWETRISYEATRKDNTKFFGIDTNSFIKFNMKIPYREMVDVMFVPPGQYEQCKKSYKGKTVAIKDLVWSGSDPTIAAQRTFSKKKIALLPTGILGGFTTYYFYYQTFIPLIEKLLQKYEVIFKNHPGFNDCWERDVREKFADNKNFRALEGFSPASDVIDESAVVITDLSTVAFDAAKAEKPVFCIVDEQGYSQIAQHRKGFQICRDIESLLYGIEETLKKEWKYQSVVERQKKYMLKITGDENMDAKELIRKTLYGIED